jgi:hypothetical protein
MLDLLNVNLEKDSIVISYDDPALASAVGQHWMIRPCCGGVRRSQGEGLNCESMIMDVLKIAYWSRH